MPWQITFDISSSAFSTDAFAPVCNKAEKEAKNVLSDNAEVYNRPFFRVELQDVLRTLHGTAAGPDKIHYQLLKHLPNSPRLRFKNIFPSDWRKAIIILIPLPGKDTPNPINDRPIALTSCICKTMERIMNRRLVW